MTITDCVNLGLDGVDKYLEMAFIPAGAFVGALITLTIVCRLII